MTPTPETLLASLGPKFPPDKFPPDTEFWAWGRSPVFAIPGGVFSVSVTGKPKAVPRGGQFFKMLAGIGDSDSTPELVSEAEFRKLLADFLARNSAAATAST